MKRLLKKALRFLISIIAIGCTALMVSCYVGYFSTYNGEFMNAALSLSIPTGLFIGFSVWWKTFVSED